MEKLREIRTSLKQICKLTQDNVRLMDTSGMCEEDKHEMAENQIQAINIFIHDLVDKLDDYIDPKGESVWVPKSKDVIK